MTFGDVLSITLLIVVTVVTLWAGIVAFAVIFSRRAQVAADALTASPGKQVGIGVLVAAVVGLLSVSLMTAGGPVSAVGFAVLAAALALAVLGSSGLALVVAARLREMDARYSPLSSVAGGAALAVAAGLLPLVGWFFIMPVSLFASLGAGVAALTAKLKTVTQIERQPSAQDAVPSASAL